MKTLQMLRGIILPILMVLGLSLLSACADQPTGNGPAGSNSMMTGILNDENGFIVPGATVEAIGNADARLAADVTTEEGVFTLKGLPENLAGVRLRVVHSDFQPYNTAINDVVSNAGGSTSGVLVSLQHADSCCATVTVAVSGPNGAALAGAQVKLRRGDKLVTVGTTGDDGTVVFTNVCEGGFNLRVAKDGYQVMERDGINVNDCESVRAEFSLRAGDKEKEKNADSCCRGYLRIVPKDSAGAVVTGAKVMITKQGGKARGETVGGEGATFREMCEGTYAVRISKEGYKAVEFTVTMRCNDSQVVDDRRMSRDGNGGGGQDSCCNGKLKVIVRDSTNNAAVGGAHVIVKKGDKKLTGETVEGAVMFEKLCNGVYTVVIEKDGFKRREFTVELGCNQQREVEAKVQRSEGGGQDSCCQGRLTVVLKDSTTNAVIANATVKLWKNGQPLAVKTTNANGVAVFENLCAGNYGVDFIREGYTSREMQLTLTCNQQLEVGRKLLKKEAGNDSSCCNAAFKFRTRDSAAAEGTWLSGVTVTIKLNDSVIATGTSGAEGWYMREALCGYRTYVVVFSKEGYRSKTIAVSLTSCRLVQETIKLSRE